MSTRMTVEQYDVVTGWLRTNKELIERTQATQLETAAMAGNALGFRVPLATVKRCAKMANVAWAGSPKKFVPLNDEDVIVLVAAVTDLFIILEQKIPDRLAELKSKCVKGTTAKDDKRKTHKWVAVLDDLTCEECRALHGVVYDQETDKFRRPPLHGKDAEHPYRCRCVLEEIKE